VTVQAKIDLTTAYTYLGGLASTATQTSAELGGLTFTPGVYDAPAGGFAITGTLTLNGSGLYVFRSGSTLITAVGSSVSLIGGAQACEVFYRVGSAATLGTSSTLLGTVLAHDDISVNNSATITGRLLAGAQASQAGAVTLNTDTITSPGQCARGTGGSGTPTLPPTTTPPTTTPPTTTPPTTTPPTTTPPTTTPPTTTPPTTTPPTTTPPTTTPPTTTPPTTTPSGTTPSGTTPAGKTPVGPMTTGGITPTGRTGTPSTTTGTPNGTRPTPTRITGIPVSFVVHNSTGSHTIKGLLVHGSTTPMGTSTGTDTTIGSTPQSHTQLTATPTGAQVGQVPVGGVHAGDGSLLARATSRTRTTAADQLLLEALALAGIAGTAGVIARPRPRRS